MSTEKLHKSKTAKLAQEQACKIIQECCEKKFAGNRKKMEFWLTGDDKVTGINVERWINGTTVPGGVLLTVLTEYPDLKDYVWAGGEVKAVDPDIEALRERIERLLESKFMFDHLETQIGICEGYQRQRQQEREAAHILQDLQRAGVSQEAIATVERAIGKKYGISSDYSGSVQEPTEPIRKALPEETKRDSPGPSVSDRKNKNPHRKK